MNIRYWIIQGTLSTVIGWGMFAFAAFAQTHQINLILPSYGNQNYESLIQQAASLAQTSIEQEFTENPNITDVSVMILGQRNGQTVPLLSAKVSRSDWQKEPIVYAWTRYFGSSEVLLGFKPPQESQSPTRAVRPTPPTRNIVPRTDPNWIGDGRGFDDEDD